MLIDALLQTMGNEMHNTYDANDSTLEQFDEIQTEMREIFRKKNFDYGNSFKSHGPVGVLVRLGDKLRRLQKISRTGVTLVNDEKLRDTLVDLANYACMAVMLLDEEDEADVVAENVKHDVGTKSCGEALRMSYERTAELLEG